MTRRVLILQDDEADARAYRDALEQAAFATDLARTAQAAVLEIDESVRRRALYDAVVLDFVLSCGDSRVVLDAIHRRRLDAAIVVVSAPLDAETVAGLIAERVCYVPKPVVGETLVAVVRNVLSTQPLKPTIESFCATHDLSAKEADTLTAAIVDGAGDAALSRRLGCRPATVETLWKRIRHKTGCATKRAVLAALVKWCAGDGH